MSELLVIGYDDPETARRAYTTVRGLHRDRVISASGLAVVSVDAQGETHVDTPSRLIGPSAAAGAVWGIVFGVLFLLPGVGLVAGAAVGGLLGKLGKSGVDEEFRRRVQDLLKPGSAAVAIMGLMVSEDRFADAMRQHGGTVLKTSLADAEETELAEQLAGSLL
ncbi:DUF1269 domain-containing protein [Streptomyces sp. ISL-43]|uniref:DUF1269 domain-containing protein n=1 Tax=Streptomyces sp. ISL-43 TaxID=2819183 RepID=UPI001BE5D7CB|nr:DUF1269 domain-containing protein [Streptomyces sp. ISL-43]MBT2450544.1 DUF1269 domain-containing protein [Streptomyces sp. ISL-43]